MNNETADLKKWITWCWQSQPTLPHHPFLRCLPSHISTLVRWIYRKLSDWLFFISQGNSPTVTADKHSLLCWKSFISKSSWKSENNISWFFVIVNRFRIFFFFHGRITHSIFFYFNLFGLSIALWLYQEIILAFIKLLCSWLMEKTNAHTLKTSSCKLIFIHLL